MDLKVFASATINGGTYDNVKIFGSARVTGDLVAKTMKVFGSTKFEGKCDIKDVSINGSCNFDSFVKVNSLKINGSCDFNNDVSVDNLKVYGSVNFNQKVFKALEICIFGLVNVDVLESDRIIVKGVLNCKEQLNADYIEITSNSNSYIKEMVGSKIQVKPQHRLFYKVTSKIRIDTIEGDDIELENVEAKTVRGRNIKIGPNCKIERVEYSESLNVSDKSIVSSNEKI